MPNKKTIDVAYSMADTLTSNFNNAEINICPDTLGETEYNGSPSDETATQTAIMLDRPLDQVTRDIVAAIPKGALFIVGGEICRVVSDALSETGIRTERVNPAAFRTWICQHATFLKVLREGAKEVSIDKGTAEAIMESHIFKDALPVIDQVCTRQLPYGVRTAERKWTFSPIELGYDERTRTYTVDSNPIDWKNPMPKDEAVKLINHQFSECRFDGGIKEPEKSTGMAIVVATMLGQFLRLNISHFPICITEANRPGAGKTFLIQTMLAPFYGAVSSASFPGSEDKQQRSILSHARSGKGVCFYDNVQVLCSNAVEQAVTSGTISYSKMYTQDSAETKNRMQFFVTGNSLTTREDTDRRARRIRLFKNSPGHDHVFEGIINADYIRKPKWQRLMLTALWGLVHGWVEAGCPDMGGKHLASFDDWRKLAANITMWAGWADPCVEQQGCGDTRENAFIEVLQLMVDKMPADGKPCNITIEDMVQEATSRGYLDDVINGRPAEKARGCFQRLKNKNLKVPMEDSRGRKFWLQEDRPTENGVRQGRVLRVYFSEVDTKQVRPEPPAVDLERCTQISQNGYMLPPGEACVAGEAQGN